MADLLSNLRLLIRVARTGSLSMAGREVGLSQSGVSRAMTSLEQQVGAVLLTRTSRHVMLTEAGADYLARIEPLLSSLEEAGEAVRVDGDLRGTLRLAMPAGIATREIVPRLPGFFSRHPGLRLDLQMEDSLQDLVRDEVDVAIRFGKAPDAPAVARPFSYNERILVAARSYLDRAGTPVHPTDIDRHDVILGPPGPSPRVLVFERGSEHVEVRAQGRVEATVNEGAVALAVAGLGLVSTGLWGCRQELADGRLIRVLDDWGLGKTEAYALLPGGRRATAAARAFTDYLVASYR